jgi:formylglycine-generating enzyme required for sulfatase activity
MGQVYLGHDRLLDRPVAIKFIAAEQPDEAKLRRFQVEARAIARLKHPNVVTVHRAGVIEGRPYLVEEFVGGQSLAEIEKPLQHDALLRTGVGLARGLAAAHRAGLVHRDVKPGNAVQADDGEVKLLDFGLAKFLDDASAESPGAQTLSLATPSEPGAQAGATSEHRMLGTPRYMAPEVRRGEPATRRSDVYSLGLVLQELGAGEPRPEARLQKVVERCLQEDPALRFPSAAELAAELESLLPQATGAPIPEGNPYRGLRAFEAEHRALFFGRGADARAVLELLRREPLVVVAGDSGAGKSSLCAAGVLPLAEEEQSGPLEGAEVVRLVPGGWLSAALARALAPLLGGPEEALRAWVESRPDALRDAIAQLLSKRRDTCLLLFIDQAEELFTLASREEAARAGRALAHLAQLSGRVRLLLALRADYLTRLAALPGLGEDALRALYVVRPLSPASIREVIVGPARCKGFTFASEEMVQRLADSAAKASGGLPLLQFALAELWEHRDEAQRQIPASALEEIGGVEGALARYADTLLAGLHPLQGAAVRGLLTRLVTAEGTRSRRTAAELGAEEGPSREALVALVEGRLVVEREEGGGAVYEVAHEALLQGWRTLREWLDLDAEERQVRQRVEVAAREWRRLGEGPAALWDRARLLETSRLDQQALAPAERAFLAASHRLLRRRRMGRLLALAVVPALAVVALDLVRTRARADVEAGARQRVDRGAERLAAARRSEALAGSVRERALAAFSASRTSAGFEQARGVWREALEHRAAADAAYEAAGLASDSALALDPLHAPARALEVEAVAGRAALARTFLDLPALARHRLRLGALRIPGQPPPALLAPARLSVDVLPHGTAVSLAAFEASGGAARLGPARLLGASPLVVPELPAGSYLLVLRDARAREFRLPLLLTGRERVEAAFTLPAAVPDGWVFIPPGRFLTGLLDDEQRHALGAPPAAQVTTGGYLIGRHEVTFADYLPFLESLSREERARRTPLHRASSGALELRRTARGWELLLQPAAASLRARWGEPIRYQARTTHAAQDWRRFPVTAVALDDAQAYARWLAASRVPGAHVCDDLEWERAARGADGRIFTTGDKLVSGQVDIDETYGREPLAYGPDEAGAHPASASVYGVEDLVGNASEMVLSVGGFAVASERGGSWFHDEWSARLPGRFVMLAASRAVTRGFRVCAPAPAGEGGAK